MRLSDNWKDYELIDASDGERLERWGDIILIRPDPQIIWSQLRSLCLLLVVLSLSLLGSSYVNVVKIFPATL